MDEQSVQAERLDGRLVRAGFSDLDGARARLVDIARVLEPSATSSAAPSSSATIPADLLPFFRQLLLRLARVASPDAALASYAAILQAQPALVEELTRFDVRLSAPGASRPSRSTLMPRPGAPDGMAFGPSGLSSMQGAASSADPFAGLPGASRADGPIQRLLFVLGASQAMGRLMVSRPDLLRAVITPDGYATHGWDLDRRLQAFHDADAAVGGAQAVFLTRVDALRACYRRQLAAILAWDLTGDALQIQPDVSRVLSDLAQAAIATALRIAQDATDPTGTAHLVVVAMGKLGARELNYVSDCDLVYVAEPGSGTPPDAAEHAATRTAVCLQKICSTVLPGGTEPPLWQIDTALRPEGKEGPLVRGLDSFRTYYDKWAENWEFQALLKARPIAGDEDLRTAFAQMVHHYVWGAGGRPGFVVSCQKMRRRVEDNIPQALREREIKLGRGGLRDVEFTVQMLQLVHGRTDTTLRASTATLPALDALVAGGYISRRQGSSISADYRFERVLEHRQQVWQLRRTHLFPDLGAGNGGLESPRRTDAEHISRNPDIRRLARSMQLSPVQLVDRYDRVRRQVRDIHTDVYYRPLLPQIAGMSTDEVRLDPKAADERYRSIGFKDPAGAARLVARLTRGSSRAARINRLLLPVMLEWLGQGNNPDMGLLQLSKLEDRFGQGSSYLGFLRDSRTAAQRLCRIISNSRYLGDALTRSIESVTWLGHDDQLRPRSRQSLETECRSLESRFCDDRGGFATGLRALRRREIERVGLGWMTGLQDVTPSLVAMSDVHDELLRSALRWSVADWSAHHGDAAPTASLILFAMGRYGGRESNFSSDADLLCFYVPTGSGQGTSTVFEQGTSADSVPADLLTSTDSALPDPASCARGLLQGLRSLLDAPIGGEQGLRLDFDLRPEGRSGPLVRSLDSAARYYTDVADTWEHQALLRCRYVAGDEEVAHRFLDRVIDPLRYPQEGIDQTALTSIRRLKARMETERLPMGVSPDRHLKLGPGGLSDIEWTVQLLQLRNAGHLPALRTTGTLDALGAEEQAGLIGPDDAALLRRTWLAATAVRNASYLWSPGVTRADTLPDSVQDLSGVAACLPPGFGLDDGHGAHGRHPDGSGQGMRGNAQGVDSRAPDGQRLANTVLSLMRRTRRVMTRLFYGYDD